MVGIKLLLLSSFLFFQGIRGYCVYNKLTDGTSFSITQNVDNSVTLSGNRFSKHMEKDAKECCPHTSKDCSFALKNNAIALFEITLIFFEQPSFRGTVSCTTGGEITIHGTKNHYYAECMNAEGVATEIPIWDLTKRITKRKRFVSVTSKDPYFY
ncbi:hypothetical protein EDC94DRAFT_647981 [Helicostylum pulchrum]|nr:hypothetical protein EDC94DRAFT_647981 [Helicostylum pulchrum]